MYKYNRHIYIFKNNLIIPYIIFKATLYDGLYIGISFY